MTVYNSNSGKLILRFFTLLLIILIGSSYQLSAFQSPFFMQKRNGSVTKTPLRDTLTQKHFGRAAGLLVMANAIPWAFNKYVNKAEFSNISFSSIRNNLNPKSWTWDDDDFGTNQFAHPYHGSLYFNAFRANGYSFWQSVPAAFVGSYLWETVAEQQYPSPNDFINTSFGGVIMGEMTYRLANNIVNNNRRGFKRQASEVLALLINPSFGFTRILDRKWGKTAPNSTERDSTKVYAEFDAGMRKFNVNNSIAGFGWYGHIKFLFGTPTENFRKPFSNISIHLEFGKDDTSIINVISVYGSLAGWEVTSKEKTKRMAVMSANYDYVHNEAFFYSTQSIKLNLFSSHDLTKKLSLNTQFGAGPVILAAVPNVYRIGGRAYDYSMGLSFNAGGGLRFSDKFSVSANYKGGWLKTISGNQSHHLLHALTGEVRYHIANGFSLCAEPGYFTLHGHYKDYPTVNYYYPYLRLSVRYSLNIQ